jgi:hypothetical protein
MNKSYIFEEDSVISGPFKQTLIVKLYLVVIAVFLFSAASASAQVTFTNDEAAFFAQNPNLAVQDFGSGSVPPGGVTECSPVLNENTSDLCFSPGDILPGIEFFAVSEFAIAGPGFNNNPFIALVPDASEDTMDITFPGNTVNAVGMDLGCLVNEPETSCSDTVFVQVFRAGDVLIGSTSLAVTDLFDSFLGIQSIEPITRINVSNVTGPPIFRFEGIDRIAFGFTVFSANIPTLSEWGMISAAVGLGLVGVFAVRKRKAFNS